MPYISADQYASTPAFELLEAAAKGFIGFDQRLIHALVDEPDRTIPDIVRFQNEPNFDWDLSPDFIVIFHYLNRPEAVPFYVAALRRYIEDTPDELTEAVVALGTPMLEPLLELYHEIGEEASAEIAFMLASLGVRDQRILDLLLERLEYEAGDGALSLSVYGDPVAVRHIERILGDVGDDDPKLRHELQSAIGQIQKSQHLAPVAPEPFNIFELYPEEAGPLFGILSQEARLSLLDGTPADVRAEAAASFLNEPFHRPVRDRLLQAAQTDPDANVRGRAWESLADLLNEPEIRKLLLEAARNAEFDERTGAIVALASGPEPVEEALPLIEALYDEPAGRAKAIEAMWKSLNPRFGKYMVQHLDDPDPLVRHHAIYGIGYLGVTSEAPRLIPLFEDDDYRHEALLAYALAAPVEVARSRMKPLLRKIEQLAGGLTEPEDELVKEALDQRLAVHDLKPVFNVAPEPEAAPAPPSKVGRNDPCPCGSGLKYKKCHGA